jgi:hypothetical protein
VEARVAVVVVAAAVLVLAVVDVVVVAVVVAAVVVVSMCDGRTVPRRAAGVQAVVAPNNVHR